MISNHPSSFIFRPPIITTFFFILVFIIQFQDCLCQQQTDDDSKKYENCQNNFTCRDGINIGYPFYGNNRPDYCGFPGYKLECNRDDQFTEIEIISQKYRVLQINQAERIMRITRRDFIVGGDACPENFTNTILNTTMFSTPENGYWNLTLSYDCPGSNNGGLLNKFNCKKNETTSGDAYFWSKTPGDGANPNCRENMEVPISISDFGRLASDPTKLLPILREGFVVTYYVYDDARTGIDACVDCIESGGACGYNSSSSSNFSCFCVNGTVATTSCPDGRSGDKRKTAIGVGIGVGVGGSLLIGILVVIFLYYRQRHKNSSTLESFRNISSVSSMTPDTENGLFPTPIFSYKELEEATNSFDDSKELGDGGFGTVYYGELKDGRAVAVKRLYENNYKRVEQFMNEVTILSSLRHPNLVILYGCTSRHSRELLLVYEFVSNGTVADHLHGERAGAGLVSWPVRMSIAIESAGALAYLHASDIIHRDVKTNNILLDDNFHVKVADFGLSRLFPTGFTHVSTAPQGTPGYVDPEYYQCYQVTDKSDVYSFGVVLIELISSKQAVDISRHRHEINLANLAISKIHKHELDELVDPSLGFQSDFSVKRMITLVAELAYRCLQQESDTRPSMAKVLEVLKGIECEGSKMVNAVEVDIPVDDVGLLKHSPPYSPDSVTQEWASNPSTLNVST